MSGAAGTGGGGGDPGATQRPERAEQRAEEAVQRAATSVTRFLAHAVARAREEIEDVVAEGRELHRHDGRRDA